MIVRATAATLIAALLPALALAGGQSEVQTGLATFSIEASTTKAVVSGTLASREERCLKGRTVKLIREHGGNKQTLGSDKTDEKGKFKVKVTDPPGEGEYYGKAQKKTLGDGAEEIVCLERETPSATVTIP